MPPRPFVPAGLLSRPVCNGRTMSLAFRPSLSSPTAVAAAARPFAASASRDIHSSRTHRQPQPSQAAATPDADAAKPLPVPPESPKYIKVPQPPQAADRRGVTHRGHLPVPRDVFNFRKEYSPNDESRPKKSDTWAWAEAATPRSKAELTGEEPKTETEAWRRRMATTRRQSLEEGLEGLWRRQEQQKRRARARATKRSEERRKAAQETVDRADDLLTRSTVRLSVAENTAVIRDPLRHERQAEKAARTAAVMAAKRDARRDALMELYQAAGKFIVDEQELRQRVDELFRPDYFKDEGYSYGTVNAENIWDVAGKPSTVQEMMTNITRTETKLYDSKRTEADRTTKRQKQVAETLTGGKMPV